MFQRRLHPRKRNGMDIIDGDNSDPESITNEDEEEFQVQAENVSSSDAESVSSDREDDGTETEVERRWMKREFHPKECGNEQTFQFSTPDELQTPYDYFKK